MSEKDEKQDEGYIHILKQPEPCDHVWPEDMEPYSCCEKCGISFMRYAMLTED